MKIALLNDTHTGVRNSADAFLNNARMFYENVFFPYIKEHDIKQIVHLGDYYDNRKAINIKALNHNRKHFLEPMKAMGLHMDIITGNHDTYFKDTNTPNSLKELLGYFMKEVTIIEKPTVMEYGSLKFALLPWIAKDNIDESMNFIKTCDADVLGGHLEISGFDMQIGTKCEHGLESSLFKRFKKVLYGHFHTKSTNGNITYLGSQLEFYWSDCNDKKYFHVLDTETLEIEAIHNPNTIFKKLIYNDRKYDHSKIPDVSEHFVKVVVIEKNDPELFEDFLDGLYKQNVYDLKVDENVVMQLPNYIDGDFTVDDTTALLEEYIDNLDNNGYDKSELKEIMRDLYVQAQVAEIV